MPEGLATRRLIARLVLEASLWYGLAAAFLAAYVGWIGAPAASIAPHLRILSDCIVVLACMRLALAAIRPPAALLRLCSALLLALFATCLVAFYALTLVGLRSWGRVITWELVSSYAPQARPLLEAAGFPMPLVAALLALSAALLLGAAWLLAKRWDWVSPVASRISAAPLAVGACAIALAAMLDLHQLLLVPPTARQEPVSLFLFPAAATVAIESNGMDPAVAARRDAAEDAARRAYRPGAGAIRRNVVLIVSDALRADHMGIYGYARDTTPNLSRLVQAGNVRVAPAVHAACSESLCGLLSLASSRYVHQFSRHMFVLQQVFERSGYRTIMILGGDHTHFYGLREQYGKVDLYFDASQAEGYVNDDRIVLDRLGKLPAWDGKPVMMQLHLMSSHLLGRRHEEAMAYLPAANYFFPANRMRDGRIAPAAINFYDDGVREADWTIARILEILARKGYLSDTVVAITADHGEGLGEHGYWAHQNSVHDEELRVPFALVSYGYQPAARLDRHRLPSQVDIAPTLLRELQMPIPANWAGRPLQDAAEAPFAFFEQGARLGLIDRRDPARAWKYWEDRASGASHAFDIAADPGERHDAIASIPPARIREWQLQLLPAAAQYTKNPWK